MSGYEEYMNDRLRRSLTLGPLADAAPEVQAYFHTSKQRFLAGPQIERTSAPEKVREKEREKVRAVTLGEFDLQIAATQSLEFVIEHMFPLRSVNILGGDSGLGKSPLVAQMAVCVAAGVPFLGHAVKKGPVLIADYENDAALSPMLHNVSKAVGATGDKPLILQRPSLQDIRDEVGRVGARLVIVDSLRGLDANAESAKSGRAPELIRELQDVDTAWLVIHHLRKQGASDTPRPTLEDENQGVLTWLESLSGSRALVNQTFTRMGMDSPRGHRNAEIVLRWYVKGAGERPILYVDRIYDEEGEPIGYLKLAGADLLTLNQRTDLRKVLAVQGADGLGWGDILTAVGSKSAASRLIKACLAAGCATKTGTARQKDVRYKFQPEKSGNG